LNPKPIEPRAVHPGALLLALFGVGAAITYVTGRSLWVSGARQLAFGMVAAAITFGIGSLVGTAIA